MVEFVKHEDLPRLIAEVLDAADKRREERAMRQQATQNLEGMRARFVGQLDVLERYAERSPDMRVLVTDTREMIVLIDDKLAAEIATNAPMIHESIRQARASLEPPAAIELMPGAALIAKHGKRR